MADFGVRDFLLRRRAGSARLQADAGRAFETARALEGAMCCSSNIHLWRAITQADGFRDRIAARVVLVTEAPAERRSRGREALGGISRRARAGISCRATRRDAACIVYSSGTGGRPKGCVLTHENYLEQCVALTSLYPFWPGVRYLSILPTNHAIDFMVRLHRAVHRRRDGRASAHAAAGIHSRSVHAIQDHLHEPSCR